jgi:hypothetical protein
VVKSKKDDVFMLSEKICGYIFGHVDGEILERAG